MRLVHQNRDGLIQVAAMVPLGSGRLTEATAEIALRVTGEAPLARVTISDDGDGLASAMAFAEESHLDSGLLKALLAEAWSAAYKFSVRVRRSGWSISDAFTEQIPRELRLGVAEDLQDQQVWAELRERLVANDCLPLADEPAALLVPTGDGQLCIGPTVLAGTARAWAIVVERVVRSGVVPKDGLWRALAARNHPLRPERFGVIQEVGVDGPPAVTVSYCALQLPRTQVADDLQHGLNFVDDAANELDPFLRRWIPDAPAQRNNLPWPVGRSWSGPGSELREGLLAREVAAIPPGGGVPSGLIDRIREQSGSLGRPGIAYLGHLALLRAERRDAAAPAWKHLARSLLDMTPVTGPGERCAVASLHVRLHRLDASPPVPRPARPAPRTGAPRPAPAPPTPAPPRPSSSPAPDAPPPEPSRPPGRRRRWRLFG